MKKRLNAKLVAMLTAFLMVFAMMPLVAFGEETPDGEIPADDPTYVETPETDGDSDTDVDTVNGTDPVDVPEEDYVVKEEQPAAFEAKGETHVHNNVSFDPWGDNDKLPDTSGSYYLTNDVTLSSTWEVPSGTTSLCLNGHGIRFAGETGSVIFINGGNTLNLCDCNSANLTHKYTVTNGLATVDDNATGENVKTFSGGFITGGNCTISNNKHGGGIFISGILNMSGGTIIGNQADHSAGVENRGTFNMSGNALVEYNKAGATGGVGNRLNYKFTMSGNATIRHNTSKSNGYGGGVTNYGDFYVSGTPVISENTMGNGVNGNVYAGRTGDYYFPIRVMGKLESGASIGVKRYDNTKGIIAVPGESYTITDSDKARFTADDARYEVNLISEGENKGKLELSDKKYPLWVGGTQVTSANCDDIPAANGTKTGKASFDADTNTLTLDNYIYTGKGHLGNGVYGGSNSAIYYDNSAKSLIVELKGDSIITEKGLDNSSDTSIGLFSLGAIIINDDPEQDGEGTLTLDAKGAERQRLSLGLGVMNYSLTINGGKVVANAYESEQNCVGVGVSNGIIINGGSLLATAQEQKSHSNIDVFFSYGILGEATIGKNADEVIASGYSKAIDEKVINNIKGKGWTDVAGTEGETDIPVNTEGATYKYKRVQFKPVHEHSFTYAAGTGDNANRITATCEGNLDCPEGYKTNGITITLNAPANLTYDGTAKAASITGYPTTTVENLAAEPAIKYFKSTGPGSTTISGNELTGAPVNAGDYVAQITWGGATASVAFSIAQVELTITAKDQTYTYNGQNQGPSDTAYDSGFDEIITVTGDLVNGDVLAGIQLDGQAKEVGEHVDALRPGGALIKRGDATVTDNYNITYVNGKIIILKAKPTPAKVSGTPLTTMTASGKTAMTIAWEKVTGVNGYDIFFARCNKEDKKIEAKCVQTISGNSTFTCTVSDLKAGKPYKAYVKAYVMKGGKKQYVKSSPLMHAYTKGYTKKHTNAKSVKVNKTKVSLNKGQTFKLKVKVKKLKKNKKLMPKKHVAKVRYLSTDTSIATVTSKGKIKGVKAGTCYVYAYAHNGVFKKITVTVK